MLRSFGLWGAVVFCFCLWGFFELAEDFPEGQFNDFDRLGLTALRSPGDLATPLGPIWLREAMRDVSALGSASVLGLVLTTTVGYFFISRQRLEAWAIALSGLGGLFLNVILKSLVARPRPEIVPHLAEVSSSSFPSGHSMLSAIVYLGLGVMVAQMAKSRPTGIYAIVLAVALTLGVGVTRVYLGVHYPTDVLAGWAAGAAWALICVAARSWWIARVSTPMRGSDGPGSTISPT